MPPQSLKFQRIVHNAVIFTISLFISFYSHIPFAFWVSATVLALMLPLETVLIQERIKAIFVGTVQGLIIFIPIWLLMDINSNLIFIFIPFCLAALNFYQIHNFTRNIAFLNINLGIFLEYIQFGNYDFSFYLVVRIMAIMIGILLVWFGELLFTHRKNYGYLEFTTSIRQLSEIITTMKIYLEHVELGQKTAEHQLTVIKILNQVNIISSKINDNYKSILAEKNLEHPEQLSHHYLALPELIKKYKVALLGIGYTISDNYHNVSSTDLGQIAITLNKIGTEIINRNKNITEEKY